LRKKINKNDQHKTYSKHYKQIYFEKKYYPLLEYPFGIFIGNKKELQKNKDFHKNKNYHCHCYKKISNPCILSFYTDYCFIIKKTNIERKFFIDVTDENHNNILVDINLDDDDHPFDFVVVYELPRKKKMAFWVMQNVATHKIVLLKFCIHVS